MYEKNALKILTFCYLEI